MKEFRKGLQSKRCQCWTAEAESNRLHFHLSIILEFGVENKTFVRTARTFLILSWFKIPGKKAILW